MQVGKITRVEKNIPLPEKEDSIREILEPFEIGDSILIDDTKRNSWKATINREFHKNGVKRFKISNKNQPEGKVRVWRVADFKAAA